jgi:hypothetical protein
LFGTLVLREFVMAGLVPAIHVFPTNSATTWMPGTSPGMTAMMSNELSVT